MNTAEVKTVKMFGPALSGTPRLVNRDVPVCDEQAYKAAGYKRGSVPEISIPEVAVPTVTDVCVPESPVEPPQVEPVVEKPARLRKRKGQE